ncbi:MAG TPA: STAS domain-containing protein [Acidimicrobiales bacterium]|nr:STAS domain-containing protein [Acidimicrobiales bacterium]
MDLAIQVHQHDGWQVVIVAGDIDVATAPRLHDHLVGLASAGHRRLAVDLEGVTMLDWMGLGALLGVLARVRSLGGELVLLAPSPATRELFALTDLDRVLPIRDRLTVGEP